MKTSILILIVLIAFMCVWSACQFDLVNAFISAISIPILILGYSFLKTIENKKL